MPKPFIRSLAQILVVLWLLILCSRYLILALFNADKILHTDPSIGIAMWLGFILPGAIAALLIVTPTRSGRFLVPDRVEGAAVYLCAALRGCLLVKGVSLSLLVVMAVQSAYMQRGAYGMWIPAATLSSQFIIWAIITVLAPWFSTAVVGQVDSGVMWYTRAWQSVKGW